MTKKFTKMHVLFYETATTMTVNLQTLRVENWLYKETMSTDYKTADTCTLIFEEENGAKHQYQGYVPPFFPGKHYGDYIMLVIEKDGKLSGFECTDQDIEEILKHDRFMD